MRTQIGNQFKGGDVVLYLKGNDNVSFREGSTFEVYIYPDNTNVASEAEQQKIKKIYSTDRRVSRVGDGYVTFVDGENAAVCTLPASITMEMIEAQYTVEIRHSTESNTGGILVMKRNTVFNLISAVSQLGRY